jgi:hypothetical protein
MGMRLSIWRLLGALGILESSACASAPFRGPDQGGPHWLEAHSEHFRLVSSQSEAHARNVLHDLEATQAVFEQVAFPSKEKPPGITEIVELPAEDFEELQEAGVVGKEFSGVSGLAGPDFDLHPRLTMRDNLGEVGQSLFTQGLAHRFVNFHFPNASLWLVEGMGAFWRTLEIKNGKAYFGGALYAPTEPTPLAELLNLRGAEFYDGDETTVMANYTAASIAVRLLYFEYREPFSRYLSSLGTGQVSESAAWQQAMSSQMPQLQASFSHFLSEAGAQGEVAAPEVRPDIFVTEVPTEELHLLWASLWPKAPSTIGAAEREVEAALRANPHSADALVMRASLSLARNRIADTCIDLEHALDLRPMRSYVLAAALEYELGHVTQLHLPRQQLVTRLLKFRLKSGELNLVAQYYASVQQVDRGLELVRQAVRQDSSCTGCYATYSDLLVQKGDWPGGVQAFRIAIALAGERVSSSDRQHLRDLEAEAARHAVTVRSADEIGR